MRPSQGGAHASVAFLLHGASTDHHFQADEINKNKDTSLNADICKRFKKHDPIYQDITTSELVPKLHFRKICRVIQLLSVDNANTFLWFC
uniref:Uncharacterized protein n=1 Tax=Trichogramma kaykai TaxID=54128 RepID=A0ABD2WEH2_9HYME